MGAISKTMIDRGYTPLSDSGTIAIGVQGKSISGCWMWTRKLMEYEGGVKRIRTAKVSDVKEIALHCYKDGWIPVEPFTDEFISELEDALRSHKGLANVPQGRFLEIGTIPPEFMDDTEGLAPATNTSTDITNKINAKIAERKAQEVTA